MTIYRAFCQVLDLVGITNTYIYSNLDPSARKIHAAKFGTGKVKVLVVTDVAARGIDIPALDNVINFNFPAKPKLFVHRVGAYATPGVSLAYFRVNVRRKMRQSWTIGNGLFANRLRRTGLFGGFASVFGAPDVCSNYEEDGRDYW